MKPLGLWIMFIATVATSPFGRPATAADVTYTVKELRFPDSPDQGAAFEHNPNRRNSFICYAIGLSQNDRISGGIVAADGKDHLFIYENGNIRDINTLPALSSQSVAIAADGTVVGIVGTMNLAHVLLYQNEKVQEITPPNSFVTSVGAITADGRFLLKEDDDAFLCSLKTPAQLTKVPLGTLTESGVIVGTGVNQQKNTPFAYKDGQTHWFSDLAAPTRKQHAQVLVPNAKGQFIATLVDGQDQKAWLVDGATNTVTPIPTLAGVATHGYAVLYLDDTGDVAGLLAGPDFEPIPFIFRAGKFSLLSTKVTGIDSLGIQTPTSILIGTLKNNHLFRYDGKTVKDLGTLGFHPLAVRCNASGQIVGTTNMPNGEEHAFLATAGKVIDLNRFMPKDAKDYLRGAAYINDHGVILADGLPKGTPREMGKELLSRTYVLTPN